MMAAMPQEVTIGVNVLNISDAEAAVLAERRRQISEEGWTAPHDDAHKGGEMAKAGAAYASHAGRFFSRHLSRYAGKTIPAIWPWAPEWWKPRNPRRDLVRAAALLIAEIERIDRLPNAPQKDDGRG